MARPGACVSPWSGSDGASQPRVGACHVQNPRLSALERLVLLHQERGPGGWSVPLPPSPVGVHSALSFSLQELLRRGPQGRAFPTTASVPSRVSPSPALT